MLPFGSIVEAGNSWPLYWQENGHEWLELISDQYQKDVQFCVGPDLDESTQEAAIVVAADEAIYPTLLDRLAVVV